MVDFFLYVAWTLNLQFRRAVVFVPDTYKLLVAGKVMALSSWSRIVLLADDLALYAS